MKKVLAASVLAAVAAGLALVVLAVGGDGKGDLRVGGNEDGADVATASALELFDRIGNVAGAAKLRAVMDARA